MTKEATGPTDSRLLELSPKDNIYVLRAGIEAGEIICVQGQKISIPSYIAMGHKLAKHIIYKGELVIKYGAPIGVSTGEIALGAHVHLHNLASNYTPTHSLEAAQNAHEEGPQK